MHTNLRVDGANCPFCLNDLIDHLRTIDGVTSVNSSISEGCIAIDHDDLDVAELLDTIRSSLHGVAMASNEIVMSPIDPVISVLRCSHEPSSRREPAIALPHRLETVTDAFTRLRADGYTSDFFATVESTLACRGCDRAVDPADVHVDQTIRFEGDTNPDDQDIVFAIECRCGCKGVYSAAYGPATPPEDVAVIRQLVRAPSS
jgi:copper chaperone CopZ